MDFDPDANDSPMLEACFGRSAAKVAAAAIARDVKRSNLPNRSVRWLRTCMRLFAA